MSRKRKMLRKIAVSSIYISALLALGLIILTFLPFQYGEPPAGVADHFISQAVQETGVINIVTAIYLKYRAYDTLGEAIVLFIAVFGVSLLLKEEKE